MIIKNYFGAKNGSGVYQNIINQIRPHDVYMELFAGSGGIFLKKKPAYVANILNDIDSSVCSTWQATDIDVSGYAFRNENAIDLLRSFQWQSAFRYCVYLDPPYPLQSRRSNREVYRYEMTDGQHRELLEVVTGLPSNVDVLVSTYKNPIYDKMLKGWNHHTFNAQTRAGTAREYLYMNYENETGELHQYDYLGTDYIDRQRIKRKIDREVKKLLSLPASERRAIIEAVSDLA